jgi:hypothetical protein
MKNPVSSRARLLGWGPFGLAALVLGGPAQATDIYWNAATGNWEVVAHWVGGAVSGTGDHA